MRLATSLKKFGKRKTAREIHIYRKRGIERERETETYCIERERDGEREIYNERCKQRERKRERERERESEREMERIQE